MCRFCDIFGERCLQHRRSHWQLGQGKERREWAQVLSNNGTKSSPHRPSRWQGPCRKAPAAAPKRDSTSLGARLEGGPIKKHIERYRNAKIWTTPQVLLLYQRSIPSLTSAVSKQRYTGRRPMWSDQRPSRGNAITCAKEYVLKSRPWIGNTCKCLGMSWHAPVGAGQSLEE